MSIVAPYFVVLAWDDMIILGNFSIEVDMNL